MALDDVADPGGTGSAALDDGRDIAPFRREDHAAPLVRLRDLADALRDPWLGPRLAYSLHQACLAAHGRGNGVSADCATCRQPWSTRRPGAVAQVTAHGGVVVMLVCNGCAADPHTARRKLHEIVERGLRMLPISVLAPGGRA
jgi:hypothetical protein